MSSSTSNSMNKIVKENINKWDELTPLTDVQINSILMLSQFESNESSDLKTSQADEFETEQNNQKPPKETDVRIFLLLLI